MRNRINGVIFHCLIRDVKEINTVENIIRNNLNHSVSWRKRRDPSFIRGYRGISDSEYLEFETDFDINIDNKDQVFGTADEIRSAINNTVKISTSNDPRFEIRYIEGSNDFLSPRDRERYNIINRVGAGRKSEAKKTAVLPKTDEKLTWDNMDKLIDLMTEDGDGMDGMLNQEEINALLLGKMNEG